MDTIEIKGLRAATRIGVPDEERSCWQTVALDVTIETRAQLAGLNDSLENTIDYFAVSQRLKAIAAERPRKLVETLAEDIASAILRGWPVPRVTVTVRKFILADTDHIAISIERHALES